MPCDSDDAGGGLGVLLWWSPSGGDGSGEPLVEPGVVTTSGGDGSAEPLVGPGL